MAGMLGMTLARDISSGQQPQRDQAIQWMQAGNYKDAYDLFRKLALDPQDDPQKVGEDLQMAAQCLANLNRISEIDAFREAVVAIHKANWRLLWAAAENYMQVQQQGFRVAGQFQRGPHRGGGEVVNSVDRDRVRALQLMQQAIPLATRDADHPAVGRFFLNLAGILLYQHRGSSPGGCNPSPTWARCPTTSPAGGITVARSAGPRSMRPAGRSTIKFPRVGRRPKATASGGGGA